MARTNAHWSAAVACVAPSVEIFRGPQACASPSWFATKREHGRVVPTWNYIAVHAHGMLEAVGDERWLHAHLQDLSRANEADRDHLAGPARGIVGLRLPLKRLDAAWKMAQHRSEAGRLRTIAGLEREPAGAPVADVRRISKQRAPRRETLKPSPAGRLRGCASISL